MNRKHTILIGLVALALAVVTVYGAMTNSATEITQHPSFITSGNQYMNPVYRFCAEVEDILEGTQAIPAMKPTVTIYGASTTLTIAESGNVIVVDGNDAGAGNVILNLPEASTAIGVFYVVADVSVTPGDDVYIKAAAGDTIDGGTAGQYLASKTDAAGQTVTLLAIDDTRWIIWAVDGTWAADDNPD